MSYRRAHDGRIIIPIEICLDNLWDVMSAEDQAKFLADRIYTVKTEELISELENRGYIVKTNT